MFVCVSVYVYVHVSSRLIFVFCSACLSVSWSPGLSPGQSVSWSVCLLVSPSPGQSVSWSVCLLVSPSPGQSVSWSVCLLVSLSPGQSVSWSVRLLASLSPGQSVSWSVQSVYQFVCVNINLVLSKRRTHDRLISDEKRIIFQMDRETSTLGENLKNLEFGIVLRLISEILSLLHPPLSFSVWFQKCMHFFYLITFLTRFSVFQFSRWAV